METVLKEICTTLEPAQMNTHQLADVVIDGMKKLRHYLPYIAELKKRFDDSERNSLNKLKQPIRNCHSWEEFCGQHLDRTPQAVNYALAKSKPVNHIEKRRNRNDPPDSFEEIRGLARRMVYLGYQTMMERGESNPAHLDSAKTWAQIRVSGEKEQAA
jgi:hypothetical protein